MCTFFGCNTNYSSIHNIKNSGQFQGHQKRYLLHSIQYCESRLEEKTVSSEQGKPMKNNVDFKDQGEGESLLCLSVK